MDNAEKFSNRAIAQLLRNIAAVYLLTGKNRFRIVAYENAAATIEHLTREIRDIWQEGKLRQVPTIGASLASHLVEYFSTGRSTHFEEVLKKVPSTVFLLMKVPGIGPKKAYALVYHLKLFDIRTIYLDVIRAAQEHRIAKLPGFGEKSEQDILNAVNIFIRKRKGKEERMPLPYAYELAKAIIAYLEKCPAVKRADALGSLRRMVATIGDIDIAVVADARCASLVIQHFINYPCKIRLDSAGEKKASIIVSPNIRVDLRVQSESSYGSMLQYFTGSKQHNIKLREYALKKGLSLSEYGIKKVGGRGKKDSVLTFADEIAFYNYLGLQYIPPELREGTDEIEVAAQKQLPNLVELKDIRGDLHVHSSFDLQPSHDLGKNSFGELLGDAQKLHYDYLGFSDHNPKYAQLSEKQIIDILKRRKEEIERIGNQKKIAYLIGLEADILPNGQVALPEKAVEYLDYLIISVHSAFQMDVQAMTRRVLQALSFPKVKILGHPTGRLLNRREGFELDWDRVFAEVKSRQIALEINAWPERLDLPDSLVREGKNNGVSFVVNSDAHSSRQMENMFYGVAVARRGWLTQKEVLNTYGFSDIKAWLRK